MAESFDRTAPTETITELTTKALTITSDNTTTQTITDNETLTATTTLTALLCSMEVRSTSEHDALVSM